MKYKSRLSVVEGISIVQIYSNLTVVAWEILSSYLAHQPSTRGSQSLNVSQGSMRRLVYYSLNLTPTRIGLRSHVL